MSKKYVFVAVALFFLLHLLCLCLDSSVVPVSGFVYYFYLYLGFPPSLLRLLYLSYAWGLSTVLVSGFFIFSIVFAIGLSTFFTTSAMLVPGLYLCLGFLLLYYVRCRFVRCFFYIYCTYAWFILVSKSSIFFSAFIKDLSIIFAIFAMAILSLYLCLGLLLSLLHFLLVDPLFLLYLLYQCLGLSVLHLSFHRLINISF